MHSFVDKLSILDMAAKPTQMMRGFAERNTRSSCPSARTRHYVAPSCSVINSIMSHVDLMGMRLVLLLLTNAAIFLPSSFPHANSAQESRKPQGLLNAGRNLFATYFSEKTRRFFNALPSTGKSSPAAMCRWLKGHQAQFSQCLSQRGFAKVLQDARFLAIRHCRRQFSYDRWDCSKVQKFLFRRIYRETAFVQAITASALMFSIAKACSNGDLEKCFCSQKSRRNKTKWHFSGCGDDLKMARNISRHFLLPLPLRAIANASHAVDRRRLKRMVLSNNVHIGFEAIKAHRANVCICHGFSGSCTMKTCKKVITHDFAKIADVLKVKYKEAMQFRGAERQRVAKSQKRMASDGSSLLYLAQSPNFCDSTRGRRCRDPNHCATLCCGRGYNFTSDSVLNATCICRFNNESLEVTCRPCETNEDYFICK